MEHGRVVDMIPERRARGEHGQAARVPRRVDARTRMHLTRRNSMKSCKRSSWSRRGRRRARRRRRAGAGLRRRHQDRRAERHVEPLRRPRRRRARCVAARMAVEDFGAEKQGHEGRDRLGRPPEQARRRLEHRAPVVRRRQGRRDRRRAELAASRSRSTRSRATRTRCSSSPARRSSDLTGKACSPNTIHWTYDTWMLANGTGSAIVKTGGDTWFFLTADYAFGHALERDTEAVVLKNGGKVLGKVRHPLNTQDFSLVPAAGAGVEGEDHRPRQRRRRHDQLDQAGGRVRHRQGRPEPRRPARVPHRRARARADNGAGPDLHRDVLLGPERPDARVRQALRGARTRASIRRWSTPASTRRCCTT